MKVGMRKPSPGKSLRASTTGAVTRKIKSATSPAYGMKGTGFVKDPKRAVYNEVYSKTTFSMNGSSHSNSSKDSYEGYSGHTPTRQAPSAPSYRRIDFTKLKAIEPEKIVVIDTETTGLNPESDEMLSVSIVNGNGTILFDHLIKPTHRKRWPKATEVNGIHWSDVKDEQELSTYKNTLDLVLGSVSVVVGYNVDFDLRMLEAGGIEVGNVPTFDVMGEFARINGHKVKLAECASHYEYDFELHQSLNDVMATLHCYKALIEDEQYIELQEKESSKESNKSEGSGFGKKVIGIILVLVSMMALLASCSQGHAFDGTGVWYILLIVGLVLTFKRRK